MATKTDTIARGTSIQETIGQIIKIDIIEIEIKCIHGEILKNPIMPGIIKE